MSFNETCVLNRSTVLCADQFIGNINVYRHMYRQTELKQYVPDQSVLEKFGDVKMYWHHSTYSSHLQA